MKAPVPYFVVEMFASHVSSLRLNKTFQFLSLMPYAVCVSAKILRIGGIVSKETVCCVGGKVKH